MSLLRLEAVSKTYPEQKSPALQEISFEVKAHEFFSIIGESGSGKTTLLNTISALETVDQGNIFFKGERINHFAHRLIKGHPEIKPIAQDYNLFPHHKIHENISYALRKYTDKYQKYRTHELLELCQLQEVAHKKPHEISGGEQQRTALAVALAQNPSIITADEPFSHLDHILKEKFKIEFRRIGKEAGVTIIFVTHDFQDALLLSDRIAVLKDGKILQIDVPQVIYNQPKDENVARLFGHFNRITKPLCAKYFNLKIYDEVAFIRPERFQICSAEQTIFKGKIIRRDYYGNYYLYKIQHPELTLMVQSHRHLELACDVSVKMRS